MTNHLVKRAIELGAVPVDIKMILPSKEAKMTTKELIQEFLKDCQDRRLAPHTISKYNSYLRHLAQAFPDGLPWEWPELEWYLTKVIKKKDQRPHHKKALQAFYAYLERAEYGKSPIPKGQVGRPRKISSNGNSQSESGFLIVNNENKLVPGGRSTLSGTKSTSISTRQAITDFFHAKGDLRPDTIRWYHWHLDDFADAYDELPQKPEPIDQFIYAVPGAEHRHGRFRAVRALYYFLEKRRRLPVDPHWGIINPVKQVTPPKVPRKLPASLDMNELQRVINACETLEEKALICLIADCGIRAGEISSLIAERVGQEFIMVRGKTGERQVSISPELRDMLLELAPKGPIFRNPWGKRLSEDGIYRVIKIVLTRAGIKKRHMGPHMLRHTYGRQAVAAGADLVTVQHELGHSQIGTTRIYTELAGVELRKRHQETSPFHQLKFDLVSNGNVKEHE